MGDGDNQAYDYPWTDAANRGSSPIDPNLPGLHRRHPLAPEQLTDSVTRQVDMPVLLHLGVPQIRLEDWTLSVSGLVDRPFSLKWDQFRNLSRVGLQAVFECAGNPLAPTMAHRRIAHVVWGGVPLRHLLFEAGVLPGAAYVWAFGSDHGSFEGTAVESYGKDLPLRKAMESDVLVADEINGEPLTAEHGFPCRLTVPGYYGTNSVKWLSHLVVADRRLRGLFSTELYNDPASDDYPHGRPVREIAPESILVSPANGATLRARCDHKIWGWAWAEEPVIRVDVSVDDGQTWVPAELQSREECGWQQFSTTWAPEPGTYRILSRATGQSGITQPLSGWRNEVHRIGVNVRI